MVEQSSLEVSGQGFSDVLDITEELRRKVENSRIRSGLVNVFVGGSTGGLTTIEFESGAVTDLKAAIERLAPEDLHYHHDARWGDGNGFSHVRAALLGPSVTIPLFEGRLELGTWQQVVFIDFDNRPRKRRLRITLLGE